MRIFISGPYSKPSHPREVQRNVSRAIVHGIWLMQKGHSVFIPHYSHYMHLHPACTFEYEEYLRNDMAWLEVSQGVLRLPGESVGADKEVQRARELGIPVFYSLEEVPLE